MAGVSKPFYLARGDAVFQKNEVLVAFLQQLWLWLQLQLHIHLWLQHSVVQVMLKVAYG